RHAKLAADLAAPDHGAPALPRDGPHRRRAVARRDPRSASRDARARALRTDDPPIRRTRAGGGEAALSALASEGIESSGRERTSLTTCIPAAPPEARNDLVDEEVNRPGLRRRPPAS